MWHSQTETAEHSNARRFSLRRDQSTISYSEVIEAWRTDEEFRKYFNSLLRDSEFSAFRWETPPVTLADRNRTFEFVVLDCPTLERKVDEKVFSDRFSTEKEVISFSNLGGDATLVVPCPRTMNSVYVHLAAFVRGASESQIDELWRMVGEQMEQKLSEKPVWLSTAGMGVSWLHVRLDSIPKYYAYNPYKSKI